jgi:hypothetical protein
MRKQENTILFSGYAKTPKNTPFCGSSGESIGEISCVIEVDMNRNVIVDCDFGIKKGLTTNFLHRIIVGYELNRGLDGLFEEIRERCQLVSKNAVIKSLEVAYRKFIDYKENKIIEERTVGIGENQQAVS